MASLSFVSPHRRRRRRRRRLQEKWKLLPAYLRVRGLVRQHIDSYNHFVNVEIRQILEANSKVVCEADPHFFLRHACDPSFVVLGTHTHAHTHTHTHTHTHAHTRVLLHPYPVLLNPTLIRV